ncbi:uncharacterized protein LOC135349986 [Halichondria panicea]|uniref:uncharacterized protein LOC135349986 n=1 Tax=Halichondria panicea TaxID=6063 RepID=UPI00312BA57B
MKFVVLNLVAVLALQLVSADHGTGTCDGLDHLIENVNPILGQCTRDAECTQVNCSSQTLGVPDATITLLPCNEPPAINIVAIAAAGDVIGNYTTSTNAVDQPLATPEGITLVRLDWIVTYNPVNMGLKIQINGSLFPALDMKVPLINTTTILIDTSVCAGAPKLQFMLAGLIASLLVAMLV